jgi:hypothetical protein
MSMPPQSTGKRVKRKGPATAESPKTATPQAASMKRKAESHTTSPHSRAHKKAVHAREGRPVSDPKLKTSNVNTLKKAPAAQAIKRKGAADVNLKAVNKVISKQLEKKSK